MSSIIFNKILLGIILISAFLPAESVYGSCVYAAPLEVKELEVGNMLSWKTLSENNNKSFIVQKSLDGIDFQTVGTIKGAGDSETEMKYRFLDIATGEEKVLYRLQQEDFSGELAHTETVLVNRNSQNNFMVTAMSSTMTDGIFTLALRSELEDFMQYSVVNYKEESVKEGKVEIVDGANMVSINLAELDNGRYRFIMNLKEEQETIIVRKVNPGEMPVINYAVKE